jgi:hypothetical protein
MTSVEYVADQVIQMSVEYVMMILLTTVYKIVTEIGVVML